MAAGTGALALKPVLHVVGCGRVGRTLARLWVDAEVLEVGWIVNRRPESARHAMEFIGAGTPRREFGPINPGDWLMLATPDAALADVVERMAKTLPKAPAVAFHLSGAETAAILRPLSARVAAVHPVCPFSDPTHALKAFGGSFALGEGDVEALAVVLPMFEAIGARIARFRPTDKRRYHAAAIAASNFLTTLDALALDLAESGGLERDLALAVLVSLQRTALDGIARDGPQRALTGPIERGDRLTCQRLAAVLAEAPGDEDGTLLSLARATVRLAAAKRGLDGVEAEGRLEWFADDRRGAGNAGI